MPHDAIWKFPLEIIDWQTIDMPASSEVISVHEQHGLVCIWAKVATGLPITKRGVAIFGTGHALSGSAGKFIGTVLVDHGSLVLHVFDGGEQ